MAIVVSVPIERSPRILVVDPCPLTQHMLRQRLKAMHPKWIVQSVETGCRAVDILERQRVDVLITETELPDIRGAQLLGIACSLEQPPVCIVHAAKERDALALTGVAHRVLPKPADDVALFTAVVSALRLSREGERKRSGVRRRSAS